MRLQSDDSMPPDMSEDYFSLDDHEPATDDVEEYLNREDTPIDYKKSSADGAIEHRQKNKREGAGVINDTPPSEQTHHMTEITDGNGRETVTQNVQEKRHGEVSTQVSEPDPDDPANW